MSNHGRFLPARLGVTETAGRRGLLAKPSICLPSCLPRCGLQGRKMPKTLVFRGFLASASTKPPKADMCSALARPLWANSAHSTRLCEQAHSALTGAAVGCPAVREALVIRMSKAPDNTSAGPAGWRMWGAPGVAVGMVLLFVGWIGYALFRHAVEQRVQQGQLTWDEERTTIVAEANRKVEEAERQRIAAEERQRAAAAAERTRQAYEQQRLAEERQAKGAAEAE